MTEQNIEFPIKINFSAENGYYDRLAANQNIIISTIPELMLLSS